MPGRKPGRLAVDRGRFAAAEPSPRAQRIRGSFLVLAVAFLAAFLLFEYGASLRDPFFSDDYLFLDKLGGASFASLWSSRDLAYDWYRPWSRELHYWTFMHLFGLRTTPYHLACFVLWLGVMAAYYALAVRAIGRLAAAVAVCGVASLAAWGILLEWAPGVQDLWMLLFALLSVLAFSRGRTFAAVAALAMALLSKETAAVVPSIACMFSIAVDGEPPRRALRRAMPLAAVVLVWAALHPTFLMHLTHPGALGGTPVTTAPPQQTIARSFMTLFNLDLAPRPLSGFWSPLLSSLPGVLLLGGFLVWVAFAARARGREAEASLERPATRRVMALGLGWTVAAWVPLLAPALTWQPYYTMLGALGAWLALAAALSQVRWLAVGIVVGLLLLRPLRVDTPDAGWGNQRLQAFGKTFMSSTEAYLKHHRPRLPRHSRLYFTNMPRGVVFLTGHGDAPALRVWFGDRTMVGSYWSEYRARSPADSVGPDYFFRYDDRTGGWIEVTTGSEEVDASRVANPLWEVDHQNLASRFAESADLAAAAMEYEKLAAAVPDDARYAYLAGLCHESAADTAAAALWFARAAALPSADAGMHARAATYARREARRR
jgi:hypothetical protein